jgi:hypothetical protein
MITYELTVSVVYVVVLNFGGMLYIAFINSLTLYIRDSGFRAEVCVHFSFCVLHITYIYCIVGLFLYVG